MSRISASNNVVTSYTFDAAGWLDTLINDLVGTSRDQTLTFDYNTANQIIERTNSNSVYDYSAHTAFTDAYVANGQNQYTSVGGVTMNYDRRGNLTNDGSKTYTYDHSNRLKTVSGGISFQYDPGGRLYQQTVGSTSTQYLYDGLDLIAEYNGTTVLRRYVHGPGLDEPLVQYNGTGTTNRTFLIADERGSIVAGTNASGGEIYINRYDEYGKPQSGNQGLFQYTGQIYLSAAGLYHYKARAYDPELGRFLQTDPIGYAAGMNLYGYVSSDPMNLRDPLGLDGDSGDPWGRSDLWWQFEIESALRFANLFQDMYNSYLAAAERQRLEDDQLLRQRLFAGAMQYDQAVSGVGAPDIQPSGLVALRPAGKIVLSGGIQAAIGTKGIVELGGEINLGSLNYDFAHEDAFYAHRIQAGLTVVGTRLASAGVENYGGANEYHAVDPWDVDWRGIGRGEDIIVGFSFKLLIGLELEFNYSQFRRNRAILRSRGRPDYSNYNPPPIPKNLPPPY